MELTKEQEQAQVEFKAFVNEHVAPFADTFDREQKIPDELIALIAQNGWFGLIVPKEYGGMAADMITYGLMCEEMGCGSASLLSLLTVHGMVIQAILRWGSSVLKERWLRKLAAGEVIGAFALTEPNIGSDASSVETVAVKTETGFILTGKKKWISFGQRADLFMIIAQCEGKPTAFLLEKSTPGFSIAQITDTFGFRAAMMAELTMDNCLIAEENMVGRIGFGVTHVATHALDYGRYTVGWGCVGLARACLEASLKYTAQRVQFGTYLRKHQLIQHMITDMIASITAARLLCFNAGQLKDTGDHRTIMETAIAKYFSSTMVVKAALDAVQIHGANGISCDYPVARYLRDAKVMEIIEGSSQMQQIIIARYGYQEYL
ncbi:acyl-CoA dehydrogenase family protein [Candidatus Magnetomonas plexicatena]|uniref:acyl-CoA dehydrogenase family protein n=1 Tax=Candidatus Magnetomonas plexicatena TaxID=2552947 RepID=UPI001C764075|nr:acyl-CoA dehydrogenase [Nitrospirales bacterium LBB_01]